MRQDRAVIRKTTVGIEGITYQSFRHKAFSQRLRVHLAEIFTALFRRETSSLAVILPARK